MAVPALSTASFSNYVAASSNLTASQRALQSLQQSLASGDLGSAQTAFNAYQSLNQSAASSSSSSSTSSQLSTDLGTLGSAISSGNLASAQQAFTTVQNDLKASSPALVAAESAASQTIQWIDDLFSPSSSADSATADPTTSILDSAYGLNPSANTTDPTTALLETKYGASSTSAGSASDPVAASAATTSDLSSTTGLSLYA
jgi:hypothetical protein